MTQRIATALIIALTVPPLAGGHWSVVEEVRQRGEIRVGVGLFEPWVMCGPDGSLTGHEIDVARKIAADMGVGIRFVVTEWDRIILGLLGQEFDIIISGMSITVPRNLLVNFTVPYSAFGVVVLARSDRAESKGLETESDYNRSDVTFAVRSGTVAADLVRDTFPAASVHELGSEEDVAAALDLGTVDAVAVDHVRAVAITETSPHALTNLFEEPIGEFPEAMALRKGDPDSLNFFNGWIELHRANGWLERRSAYWFRSREWVGQLGTGRAGLRRDVPSCRDMRVLRAAGQGIVAVGKEDPQESKPEAIQRTCELAGCCTTTGTRSE